MAGAPQPKVVILCGGQGTRMREETEWRPKPMIDVGGHPLLWHIMKIYANAGFRDFVLCLGYRGEMIKSYFANYHLLGSDFQVDLATGTIERTSARAEDWRVTLADTGPDANTGARISRASHYFDDNDVFLCTYGDGVANLDVAKLLAFHRSHGHLATVTGVHPPARFGEIIADDELVSHFAEKPQLRTGRINAGFFVFDRRFLELLSPDDECTLEREPLERAAALGELAVFRHDGFWASADTLREVEYLRSLWQGGAAPWRVWDELPT
jgi:glucose-1-phosphate cytidylyltransferase